MKISIWECYNNLIFIKGMTVIFVISMKKKHTKYGAHWITRVADYYNCKPHFSCYFFIARTKITVITYI